jgi:hypothetical protein
LSVHKPAGAPVCFGRQYDDQDSECQHSCEYMRACKPEFLRSNGMLPVPPQYQAQPTWPYHQTPSVPIPAARPRLPVIQPQSPQPQQHVVPYQPQQPAPAAPVQPPPQSQLPTAQAFNPYFQQYYRPYPGESTIGRVGAHIGLRLMHTLFSEAAKFCEVWRPEPPSGT